MIRIQPAVRIRPCSTFRTSPCAAAASAFFGSCAPRWKAITALIPIPKPMVTAFTRFCTGYTSDSAVMASSLICATKKLSTMLYSELTIMEITMGSDMRSMSFNTGCSFI